MPNREQVNPWPELQPNGGDPSCTSSRDFSGVRHRHSSAGERDWLAPRAGSKKKKVSHARLRYVKSPLDNLLSKHQSPGTTSCNRIRLSRDDPEYDRKCDQTSFMIPSVQHTHILLTHLTSGHKAHICGTGHERVHL